MWWAILLGLFFGLPVSVILMALIVFVGFKLCFRIFCAVLRGIMTLFGFVGPSCKNVLKGIAVAIFVAVLISMFF